MLQTLPIMLVLCLMFSGTYYAKNYASILIIPLKPGMSLTFHLQSHALTPASLNFMPTEFYA